MTRLQAAMQRQMQMLETMHQIMKMQHDMSMAAIRNIRM
jgi:hypothetical protein